MLLTVVDNMLMRPLLSCLLLQMALCAAEILHNVTVSTKYGDLVGVRQQEHYDIGEAVVTNTVDVFMGVPYAAPPVGNLRFMPPRPPDQWDGARDATKAGPVCPQTVYYTQTAEQYQSEDCLSLNIYSPLLDTSASVEDRNLPVMVFIHGGSYEEGAGSRYNGVTLAQHGVVVVTINYRLGVLGFLTNGEKSLPGNYGILDQIEALRWVSDNIVKFRGDSCKVTLFGSDAGSASVGLLMLSPLSTGLFHRVILQSGSPLAFWAVYNGTVNHAESFNKVSRLVGCKKGSTDSKIECMRGIQHPNFTRHHWDQTNCSSDFEVEIERLFDVKTSMPSRHNFKPRMDGDVLPNHPRNMFMSRLYHNVTAMIGTLDDEWARSMDWFVNEMHNPDPELNDEFEKDALKRSIYHVIETRFSWPRDVADAALFIYTDWSNVTDSNIDRDGFKNMMSDLIMVAPSIDLADILAARGSTVYYYNYNHSSIFTEPAWWKCYHSLELDSVFGSPFTGYNIAVDGMRNHTDEDKEISRVVMALWSNFAKYGNPTRNPVEQITWNQMEPAANNYLHIDSRNIQMRSHLRADKMAFWNTLVPSLRGVQHMFDEGQDKSKPADLNLTLSMFFGTLGTLSFLVTLGLVVRTGNLQKRLDKFEAASPELV